MIVAIPWSEDAPEITEYLPHRTAEKVQALINKVRPPKR